MKKARNTFYTLLKILHHCEENLNIRVAKIDDLVTENVSLYDMAKIKANLLGSVLKLKEVRSLRIQIRSTYHILFQGYGTRTEELKEIDRISHLEKQVEKINKELKNYYP